MELGWTLKTAQVQQGLIQFQNGNSEAKLNPNIFEAFLHIL